MLALISLLALTPARLPQSQDQKPLLTGRWTYNDSLSDNARDKLGDTTAERRGRRGGGGGMDGGGMGGRRGMGGVRGGFGGGMGGGNESEREGMRATIQMITMHPVVIDIAQADTALTFTVDGEPPVVLAVNGRKVKYKLSDDIEVESKGKWQGFHYYVEHEISHGGKITEEYMKSGDGKQLYVIVKVEGLRGRDIQFRRIYDASTAN